LGRPLTEWEEDVLADVTVDATELVDGRGAVVVDDEDDDDVFR
jgi:hypothetical protein